MTNLEVFMGIFLLLVFVVLIILTLYSGKKPSLDELAQKTYGHINTHMNCPHCNCQGKVRTKPISQKKGISGGKATAALMTGGISLLATGLARKEIVTQAHCMKCTNTWFF